MNTRKAPLVRTMSGFLLPKGTTTVMEARNGRVFSGEITKAYMYADAYRPDTNDSYALMKSLMESPAVQPLLFGLQDLKHTNVHNKNSVSKRMASDYHGFFNSSEGYEWGSIAIPSRIIMFLEENKDQYQADKVKVTVETAPIEIPTRGDLSAKELKRMRVLKLGRWLSSVGWRTALDQLFLVYGDIRRFDSAYLEKKKLIPVVKIEL